MYINKRLNFLTCNRSIWIILKEQISIGKYDFSFIRWGIIEFHVPRIWNIGKKMFKRRHSFFYSFHFTNELKSFNLKTFSIHWNDQGICNLKQLDYLKNGRKSKLLLRTYIFFLNVTSCVVEFYERYACISKQIFWCLFTLFL